jgi:hypothetical protein
MEFVLSHISKSRCGAPSDVTKSSGQRLESFPDMVQAVTLLVPHPFRRKRGMDGAPSSIAKEETL